jgi:hypothetical protein
MNRGHPHDFLILAPCHFPITERVGGFPPDCRVGQRHPIPVHVAVDHVMVLFAQGDQVGMAI